jgi:hypothetical protein
MIRSHCYATMGPEVHCWNTLLHNSGKRSLLEHDAQQLPQITSVQKMTSATTVTWDHIGVRMTQGAKMASDHINNDLCDMA